MAKLRIGFIGLGLMGAPMAKNILKAGFPLMVYNRNPLRTKEFKKMGVAVAETPAELAAQSDVVITIITGPKDVEEVVLGKGGVVEGAKKGLIVIDMSTIGPEAAKGIGQKLSAKKIEFLDAPVTGGTIGAEAGTLTIFAAGKQSVFKKVKPVLEAMGKNVLYIGPSGSGQAIKLVNNLLVGQTLVSLAEAMLLADAEGLSRKKVAQFLENVPVISGMMKTRMNNMVKRQYKVSFSVANTYKDLNLARQELKKAKKELPVLEAVEKLYRKAKENGLADADNSSVLKVIEK